jgi:hypothetical protein
MQPLHQQTTLELLECIKTYIKIRFNENICKLGQKPLKLTLKTKYKCPNQKKTKRWVQNIFIKKKDIDILH